jgi:hypothetical protein
MTKICTNFEIDIHIRRCSTAVYYTNHKNLSLNNALVEESETNESNQ